MSEEYQTQRSRERVSTRTCRFNDVHAPGVSAQPNPPSSRSILTAPRPPSSGVPVLACPSASPTSRSQRRRRHHLQLLVAGILRLQDQVVRFVRYSTKQSISELKHTLAAACFPAAYSALPKIFAPATAICTMTFGEDYTPKPDISVNLHAH